MKYTASMIAILALALLCGGSDELGDESKQSTASDSADTVVDNQSTHWQPTSIDDIDTITTTDTTSIDVVADSGGTVNIYIGGGGTNKAAEIEALGQRIDNGLM